MRANSLIKRSAGQALLETALMLPLMLLVLLNALNLGYFLFVIVNLTSATRNAAEYSIIGPGSPGTTNYASANTGTAPVTALLYEDLTGAVWGTTNFTNVTLQVCSPSVGTTSGSPTLTKCIQCSSSATCSSQTASGGSPAPDADPEQPLFLLNRIDVKYSFPPLIPGSPFNLVLMSNLYNSGTGLYTFYRHIEMRAM